MRFAYADPPYFGLSRFYTRHHPEAAQWDELGTHRDLIARLGTYDGWAMSLHSPSLQTILPLCPADVRVGAWVKPFAIFKPNVNPGYTWEPVIFSLPERKRERSEPTVRDWCSVNITLKRGLVGAKPDGFAFWIFEMLGIRADDELHDLFPGTGAIGAAFRKWERRLRFAELAPAGTGKE